YSTLRLVPTAERTMPLRADGNRPTGRLRRRGSSLQEEYNPKPAGGDRRCATAGPDDQGQLRDTALRAAWQAWSVPLVRNALQPLVRLALPRFFPTVAAPGRQSLPPMH